MKARSCFLVPVSVFLLVAAPLSAAPVIVHEWGTFTSFQDAQGNAIGGINVDDEPVPYFVSSVAVGVAPQYGSGGFGGFNLGLPPYEGGKAWIAGDPQVTMRLETPVLYFYPPKGTAPQAVPPLDVQVDFHGGVLSQFYPHAAFSGLPLMNYPGNPQMSGRFPYIDKATGLTEKTTTRLLWQGVQLGSSQKPVETDDKVWTTPREVSAPVLQVKFSEADFNHPEKKNDYVQAEHFLFYRGVGHLDSPLSTNLNEAGDKQYLSMESTAGRTFDIGFSRVWLVEIRPDGACAFSTSEATGGAVAHFALQFGSFCTSFTPEDFSPENLTKLKASMQGALIKKGLYPDEASAMLRTWDVSYFKSPGLRLFYLPCREWVDQTLPLKITGAPTEITRVMVGRIELIGKTQEAALARLAAGPCPDLAAVKQAAYAALQKSTLPIKDIHDFYTGAKPLTELGIPIPPLVRDYLSLGRFRDALIVHEEQVHPSPALAQFIARNKLKQDNSAH